MVSIVIIQESCLLLVQDLRGWECVDEWALSNLVEGPASQVWKCDHLSVVTAKWIQGPSHRD